MVWFKRKTPEEIKALKVKKLAGLRAKQSLLLSLISGNHSSFEREQALELAQRIGELEFELSGKITEYKASDN